MNTIQSVGNFKSLRSFKRVFGSQNLNKHGISSKDLIEGADGIYEKRHNESIHDLDLGALFRDFC
ncbi:Competence protein [Helicobacter fennelliae]|uniref:Competence protein n=1 Tax=Helicobacter fennelliae TaxID=215 RepID=A0A2X3EFF7_9HELI|nr:hypothetical protein [Helicobacter fennelliae]SQC36326.1 Competence protein [Helicobacter fennelliae]